MSDVLRSRVLGALRVPHAFNLRTGGVSDGAYASFNLGRTVGDDPAAVAANLDRFACALGIDATALFETSQVHGAAVRIIGPSDVAASVRAEEADAVATAEPGRAVGVRVADCAAVLMIEPQSRAVAAAHAGWRGVVQEVVPRALEGMLELSGRAKGEASAVRAAIFPHIRACCFEVGPEVAEPLAAAAARAGAAPAIDERRAKPHVDLSAIIRAQLVAGGVQADHIDDVPGCTRCEPERFFSFRRDGQRSGRHIAAIVAG